MAKRAAGEVFCRGNRAVAHNGYAQAAIEFIVNGCSGVAFSAFKLYVSPSDLRCEFQPYRTHFTDAAQVEISSQPQPRLALWRFACLRC